MAKDEEPKTPPSDMHHVKGGYNGPPKQPTEIKKTAPPPAPPKKKDS
jgi:hypothetical protein